MRHEDISEICTGLVLNHKINPQSVNTSTLLAPYDRIVAMLQKGSDMTELIDVVGMAAINAADEACKRVDGKLPADWLALLEKSSARSEASVAFTKAGKALSQGEDIDIGKITTALEKINGNKLRFIRASEVEDKPHVWRPTYYAPIDKYLGNVDPKLGSGFPEAGLVICGGPPGCLVGETEVTINRAGRSLRISMEKLEYKFNGGTSAHLKWDESIPTTTRSMHEDGTIRLNLIDAVMYSGDKECYTLTTKEGHTLTGTVDHPIYTPTGKVWLSKLHPGDLIYVDGGQKKNSRKKKDNYLSKEGLKYHPYAGKRGSNRWAVPFHRIVVEAHRSHVSVNEFVDRCRLGWDVEEFFFISPMWSVHHIDGDTYNNSLINLKVLTHDEHFKLHAKENWKNVNYSVTTATVAEVKPVGIRKTYDISMRDDPHNFVANGIVVSNTGKSSLMVKIFGEAAKAGKTTAIFTLEMTNSQITQRLIETTGLTKEERGNIILSDEQMDAEDVYAYGCQLASLHDLHFIGVDFADLMVSGDEDDAKVGKIYRTMAKLAKATKVPVFLLAQLNREYVGGIPRITNLRYSGLAEAMGALIFLLYNPRQIWAKMGTDERLPLHDGRAYIIAGKSRFGFREGGVGAIEVEWDGLHSWGTKEFGYRDLS